MLILWCSCFKMHTITVACCRYGDNDDVHVTCIARTMFVKR